MIGIVYENVVKDSTNEFIHIGKFISVTDIDLKKPYSKAKPGKPKRPN